MRQRPQCTSQRPTAANAGQQRRGYLDALLRVGGLDIRRYHAGRIALPTISVKPMAAFQKPTTVHGSVTAKASSIA
ncbi:hypothetical protein [Variovorax guangxiensis]|uniref:hypothetical protein n=1 Tax=Variovorax guangxiensis TaxID=1775474 RepID=UPI002864DB9D|nr:hypothetical protein [Variovorax guangxiensis]MDR6861044.1 hypothetical protein [Variovorax guangxiensis]